MSNGWYPDTHSAQIPWWATFYTECNNYKTTFTTILTTANMNKIAASRDMVATLANMADLAKNYASDIVAYQAIWLDSPLGTATPAVPIPPGGSDVSPNAVVGIEDFARTIVAQLKAAPAMTPAIQAAMGIASGSGGYGNPAVQTVAALGGSQMRLRCTKAGYPALQVSSRRGGGGWEVLGISVSATYTDTRAPLVAGQPEVREYRIQGYLDNAAQGTISSVKSLSTTP